MLQYQVGRRVSWAEHGQRKKELFEEQSHKCHDCGQTFQSMDEGVRHHPQMISAGGVDLPGIANECWICHECHAKEHPWLKYII